MGLKRSKKSILSTWLKFSIFRKSSKNKNSLILFDRSKMCLNFQRSILFCALPNLSGRSLELWFRTWILKWVSAPVVHNWIKRNLHTFKMYYSLFLIFVYCVCVTFNIVFADNFLRSINILSWTFLHTCSYFCLWCLAYFLKNVWCVNIWFASLVLVWLKVN